MRKHQEASVREAQGVHYHWQCPECGCGDDETGHLATERMWKCGLCAGDGGDDVSINKWPAVEGMTRDQARELARR